MPTSHASPTLTLVFTTLAAAVAALASWGAARATSGSGGAVARPFAPRLLVALGAALAWMAAWIVVARTGALLDFARRPPPMMLMMLATVGAGLAIGLSPLGARLARGLPLAALVGFQAF